MMDCCGGSDIGRERSSNQDQFLISDVSKSMRIHQTSLALDHQTRLFGETKGKLVLVADGMGGHEAGERASQLVIDTMVDFTLNRLSWFIEGSCDDDDEFQSQLKQGLIACQRQINRETAAIPQRRGMGSTLTLAYIVWPRMFLVHVGDSRCYLLRDGVLQQLTRDHTLAELAGAVANESGSPRPTDQDAPDGDNAMSHILWNVIGGDGKEPHPDATALELRMGDTLLLCTDGLNKHLSHSTIRQILSEDLPTNSVCQKLIDQANLAGGTDNTTVVVTRFSEAEPKQVQLQEATIAFDEGLEDTAEFPVLSEKTVNAIDTAPAVQR
ncbi:PP2C family protein-serine/threonine phosphatase [Aureliella helgolandensis]|nr:protein phosphatase 2C domain-containing protein [Aureliella helgolandensis]